LLSRVNTTFEIWKPFLQIVAFVFSTAKSTELLPNSQEGSKRIPSVHSSANAANQSSATVGFEEGEPDNPGKFEVTGNFFSSFSSAKQDRNSTTINEPLTLKVKNLCNQFSRFFAIRENSRNFVRAKNEVAGFHMALRGCVTKMNHS